jgi:hypothetical protein
MQDIRDLAARFHTFVTNDFQHLALEVAYIKGQLKVILLALGIITAAVVGLVVQEAFG